MNSKGVSGIAWQASNGSGHSTVPNMKNRAAKSGQRPNSAMQTEGFAPSATVGGVSMTDWEVLLNAIKYRLLSVASEVFVAKNPVRLQPNLEQIQSGMVECVAGLDQLHQTLSDELTRRKHLQLQVVLAQAALARKHIELQGTRAQERRARYLARHDGLTTLPNRGHFCKCLDQALEQENPAAVLPALAVFFLDLDGFKHINDTHGHDKGDEVLKIVGARIKQAVRTDDMVGRLGGDEFACFLTGFPGRDQIFQQANKIFDAVSAQMAVGDLVLEIRPSIGIAVWPQDGVTGAALLQQADQAMYRAKRNGAGIAFLQVV